MPIFDYECDSCGDRREELVRGDELDKALPCPKCGKARSRVAFSGRRSVRTSSARSGGTKRLSGADRRRSDDAPSQHPGPVVSLDNVHISNCGTGVHSAGGSPISIVESSFSHLQRGIVVGPDAPVEVRRTKFSDVGVPVERLKK
jgi:putative FmdB family regulatory protein